MLPFVDLSPEKDQEYLCDGIAETLINSLSNIKDLQVPARTSAFSFKDKEQNVREIGKKLNVEAVLEGSVQKAPKIAYSLEDVDGDGYIDMMTFFDVQELVSIGTLTGGTTELLLSAALDDDTQIEGSDSVNIVH